MTNFQVPWACLLPRRPRACALTRYGLVGEAAARLIVPNTSVPDDPGAGGLASAQDHELQTPTESGPLSELQASANRWDAAPYCDCKSNC